MCLLLGHISMVGDVPVALVARGMRGQSALTDPLAVRRVPAFTGTP